VSVALTHLLARAAVHALSDQTREAAALYRLALRADPGCTPAREALDRLGEQVGPLPDSPPDRVPQRVMDRLVDHYRARRLERAAREITAALERWPTAARLWNLLGVVQANLKAWEASERAYRQAIALDEGYGEAWYNLGNLFKRLRRHEPAVAAYRRGLQSEPDSARTHNNLANVLHRMGQHSQALHHYQRALEIDPERAVSEYNLGNLLWELGRHQESCAAYKRAVALRPDYAKAHHNLANNLRDTGDLPAAVEHYRLAVQADPTMHTSTAAMLHQQAQMCDWTAWDAFEEVAETLGIQGQAVPPFDTFGFEDHPERLLIRTRRYLAAKTRRPSRLPTFERPSQRPRRLRIGYLSADFHDHATMWLLAGTLRAHDRDRFEVHAISYGRKQRGAMREVARDHVDGFHEVSGRSDREIVRLCRELRLDVAVDLKGWTKHARPQVLIDRVAPVQINYLGYPGSMGSTAWDWILADPVVIPEREREHYDEAVLYLPDCYQCNDDQRPIADVPTTRADHGLPDDAVVLCCFNKTYKLSPREMDIWARVLKQVDNAVLWLFRANPYVQDNLRAQARARGLDPDRLVFGDRLPHHEHLARYRHADLFVDTFAVNAHTTASDALWAGCPMLTLAGRQFAARVAASIVHAVGLPELVTSSPQDYEARLLELAQDRPRLRALREHITTTRAQTPLFDTARYTRHLEQAYDRAHAHWRSGREPDDLWVQAEPD